MKGLQHLRKVLKGTLSLVCALGLVLTSSQTVNAAYSGDYFGMGLDYHDGNTMEIADGWTNGGMFSTCTWRSGNVGFGDGKMYLSITSDPYGATAYAGGEYRTKEFFGYGMYDVSMKPIKNDGVVSSFFTYTGPCDGNQWDEIDIEFLGKDTTKVQFNYFTNGVGGHEYVHNLGFDASQGFHTYGFLWEPGKITWYVDGVAVHTATDNIPTTPGKIMMNAWPGTGVDSWLNPFNGKVPLTAEYDWASYTSLSSLGISGGSSNSGSSNSSSNNGIVSGGAYFINSKYNSKAVDISGWSYDNGGNIQQWDYLGQSNQQWIIEKQSNGYYTIKSVYNGKVLDVADFSMSNGGNVHQWDYVGGMNQLWSIEQVGNAYKITNAMSGKVLDVADYSTSNGGNLHQWDYVGGDNQLWYFTRLW